MFGNRCYSFLPTTDLHCPSPAETFCFQIKSSFFRKGACDCRFDVQIMMMAPKMSFSFSHGEGNRLIKVIIHNVVSITSHEILQDVHFLDGWACIGCERISRHIRETSSEWLHAVV